MELILDLDGYQAAHIHSLLAYYTHTNQIAYVQAVDKSFAMLKLWLLLLKRRIGDRARVVKFEKWMGQIRIN